MKKKLMEKKLMEKSMGIGITILVLAISGCGSERMPGSEEALNGNPVDTAQLQDPRHSRRPESSVEDHEPPEVAGRSLGMEVEDFAVTDNTGKAFRLAALRRTAETEGKIAVLTFWCSTCGSCRMIEKEFDAKARQYREKGVLFLAVDSNFMDSSERVTRFQEENDLTFPVLMDSGAEIARYFGARFTTTTAVIDAGGRLRYYGGFGKAEDAVRDLLAGEEVTVPESPGFGCAILFEPRDGGGGLDGDRASGHASRGHGTMGLLDHLRERLDLTDEQSAEVAGALDRLQRETQRLRNPSPHEFMALRRQAMEDIRAALTEEQRSELDELEMGHGHGPREHDGGHAPPEDDPGHSGHNDRSGGHGAREHG